MKLGLAAKLALLLTAIGILAAGSTGYYAYRASRALLVQSAKNELLTSTRVLARRIALTREEISRNLRILARHPAAISVLRRPDPAGERELATLFKLMMAANPSYFEMRLISAADYGLERVRVDRDGKRLLRVTGDDLQEKRHYAYVYETLKLSAGKTYMSRVVINHERGAHAGLDQPTVQLAMPVVDGQGTTLGVIVINVDLDGTFALLAADLPKDYQLFLANSEGDYLIHPDKTQTFGFDKGRRVLIQGEFPATADLVSGKRDQVLVEAHDGRYAKTPVVAAFLGRKVTVASDETRLVLGLAQPLAAVLAQADRLGETTLRIVVVICLVCILLAVMVARAVTRPINSMIDFVKRFAEQRQAGGLPLERTDEIGALARGFDEMGKQINLQLADLRQSHSELEHLARHDTLTGLPNRALFDDRVNQALSVAQRDQTRLVLMFIDIDHFKPINDGLGHAIGDRLLQEVAHRIRQSIRDSDTAARFGGDEFIVLLRNIVDGTGALTVAEKIRMAINQVFDCEAHRLIVSASIGIAIHPEHGADIVELSRCADEAMYEAKSRGRNTVVVYSPPG